MLVASLDLQKMITLSTVARFCLTLSTIVAFGTSHLVCLVKQQSHLHSLYILKILLWDFLVAVAVRATDSGIKLQTSPQVSKLYLKIISPNIESNSIRTFHYHLVRRQINLYRL